MYTNGEIYWDMKNYNKLLKKIIRNINRILIKHTDNINYTIKLIAWSFLCEYIFY